ncbi:hypothetical protein MAHJHV58_50770 [Mycobacterium avium subsp. hominissuis]|jgi:hypothetical protein|uniref:Uncharacterized protein n=2 Tax=Mycobacteriaceae TaxID=1762 RepID=A0AAI8X137_MYCAV|nr:hypothetical protein AOT87_17880 [Mycobacteroides sp. H003]KRQ37986.1 hypothetical protein AOT91_00630 [Mycobacteroides sp. H092]KRQ47812.1 hypothetical protein AOT92_00360 [Mycobacteroides sp. H101]KRQ51667.1 hypothetical protein AOT88_05050 [Mycobacteroides sp. H063]KRQ53388.1 hypothetical protein AOT94_26290 [Mycobacteroides sp. HXVII]KRQ69562.1 hypothetical protein AOT90_00360 [Mycobacteroides sp. H079]KRQ74034.1 hypothetical protein AOT93_26455 [Mycobacteroides sp. H110]KRQ85149.1 hy
MGLVHSPVDAFVAQPHQSVLGVFAPQVSGDLLRAPPLSEELGDQVTQGGILVDPPLVTTRSALNRPAVGFKRPVLAVAAAVAAQLPRYGRWCPAKRGGDLPNTHARAAQIGDADPLLFG